MCCKMTYFDKPKKVTKDVFVQGWCDWPYPSYKTRLRRQQKKQALIEIRKYTS